MRPIIRNIFLLTLLTMLPSLAGAQFPIRLPKIPSIKSSPQTTATPAKNDRLAQAGVREAFYDESKRPLSDVAVFMRAYDPNLSGNTSINTPNNAAEWAALMTRMEALDKICKKYPNLTNDPAYPSNSINGSPVIWCAIAADRVALEKKTRGGVTDAQAATYVRVWRMETDKAVNDEKGWIYNKVQRMLFDPNWKTEEFAEIQKRYAKDGLGTPSMSIFDAIEPDLAKVRERIDRDSKTNSWEKPPYSEPAMESFFKTKLLANPYFKGIQVLKIGSNYSNWRVFKNSIGIPTNQYKRGLYLAKLSGQNGLCQIREWIVKQEYIGGGKFGPSLVESYSQAGIYAKCQ